MVDIYFCKYVCSNITFAACRIKTQTWQGKVRFYVSDKEWKGQIVEITE